MYDLGIKTSLLITDSGESAIIDSLNSDDSNKLLSANQGKILNDKITVLTGTGEGSIHLIVKDSLESIEEITWNEKFNINDYTKSGVYVITGNRLYNKDNLPILNSGENASFSAKLFVTESPEGTTTYRSIIGQTLFLSNAEGHETKIYTRSANKTIPEGGSKYKVTWGDWQVMLGMKEVGVVDSYDSFVDNGMYSGVYDYNNTIETFVLIIINDYVVKRRLNQHKSVSQLKYSVDAFTSKIKIETRTGINEPLEWGKWSNINDVVDNLITDDPNIALSARQGKILNEGKQNQLKYYEEGESFARMRYVKETASGGNISIANMLNTKQAGVYYAERDAAGQVIHEDNIYLTETYGNDEGHIGISSADMENGVTINSSHITVKPTMVTIQNNSGLLQFVNNTVQMRSNRENDGLDSVILLTKEQAWLMHYLPELVDYINPSTGETEQRQSGIGIVASDDSIAFYSELGNYTAPFTIRKDGKIRMSGVSNDLANFLTETNGSVASIKQRVYELGDFLTTGDAERKAAEETISKNPSISIIHYTVNGTTSHIIIQDVNEDFTQQVLYYGGYTYIRHIGANLNASWRKTNPTNIKYNQDSHRIALMHMVNQYGEGDNNIDWVELPTASGSTDGLMTKEQVKSLDDLATYIKSLETRIANLEANLSIVN